MIWKLEMATGYNCCDNAWIQKTYSHNYTNYTMNYHVFRKKTKNKKKGIKTYTGTQDLHAI